MHLLQAGVDIPVIALWLGHESTQTTHGYIEADLALKEKARSKVAPASQKAKRFRADDELLRFLSLCATACHQFLAVFRLEKGI